MSEHIPSTAPKPTKVDVLIIGAGPAGLMCAIALAQAGVNVKIIDQMYAVFAPRINVLLTTLTIL